MLDALQHRGPDTGGLFEDPGVVAGIRRLAVIDVEGGDQPIANEDGAIQVVFNGEIYNHAELRDELQAKGHRFRTRSDTEVLVHLWEEYRQDMLGRLNGMFAFCLSDRRTREVFIARDRLGIKPLFYWRGGDRIVFASELRALLQHPEVPRAVDADALVELYALQYVAGDRTVYRDVEKLLPGHALHVVDDRVRLLRYYRIPEPDPVDSEPGVAEKTLRSLLQSSVDYRRVADVPVGMFLSGGLDSSALLAVLRASTGQALETFSVGFEDQPDYDERAYARSVAERFDSRHHELVVSAVEIAEHLPQLTRHLAEPVMDPAIIPTYLLSRYAKERVTVALTGEGADELFGGYRRYAFQRRYGWVARVGGLRRLRSGALGPRWPGRTGQAFDALLERDPVLNHLRWSSTVDWSWLARLFDDEPTRRFQERARATFSEYFPTGQVHPSHQLRADQHEWLPHNLLAKVDRASMAFSLEARVPFLDHRLVEWAAQLPDDAKVGPGGGKRVLRSAFEEVLPPEILGRGKRGFDLPLDAWLRGPLRELTRELTEPESLSRWPGLSIQAVRRMRDDHLSGARDLGLPLFNLVAVLVFLAQSDAVEPHTRTGA
jgi:asparagine synthase (glutamine-hydrolysing)